MEGRAAGRQEGKQYRRLGEGPGRRLGHLGGAVAQGGDQHQQRHHGQVLEQQHAHHAAAVLGVELDAVGHHLDDDGGRAHGQRATQGHGALPADAPAEQAALHAFDSEPGQAGTQSQVTDQRGRHRQRDLAQAQPEHQRAHAAQLGQVELQPDDEHQEDHAELGQVLDAGRVLGQRQSVGPDHDAHRQVAQHGRQLGEAAQHHADHGGEEVKQREFERGGHVVPRISRS